MPLSYGQQLLWLHGQLAPDLPVYNEPITVHRTGPLDVGALEASLTEILRRHEAWRTTFAIRDGQPVQAVQAPPRISLPVVDLRGLPPGDREAQALRLATEDARQPFDLARGPLLRAKLIRLGDTEHRLYLTLHHIIFDGVSTYHVFLPELTRLYEAYSAGLSSPLAEPALQYGDYACWQRQAEVPAQQMSYWRQQLRDAPDLELPGDRPRPPVQTFRGAMQPLALAGDLSEGLRQLSHRLGATLFMTLLTSFKILLHRHTGQTDLVVGTVTAGRSRPELQGLLGFFLNPLMLRTDLSGDPTFSELLWRVRDVTLQALANEDVPFELLVKELRPRRAASGNPLYQALFSLEPPMPRLPAGWNLTQNDIETGTAKLDLYLELDDRPSGIVGRFMYNTDLFERSTIARLLAHWETLLAGIVADPERRLSKLRLLSDAERLRSSSRRDLPQPGGPFVRFEAGRDQTIGGRFEAMAAAHAPRVAVKTARGEWTYDAINRAANRVAREILGLRGLGEERIALLFDHDQLMIAGLLGTLKAGKAYVPLDPLYPRERLLHVLRDSRASLLLTTRARRGLARELADESLPIVAIDELDLATPGPNVAAQVRPDALAYILYTSGSTGLPKGVMQTQQNVLRFIASYTNALHIHAGDRLSLLASYSFDAAVIDVFAALLNGATLCPIAVRGEAIHELPRWLASLDVTVYHSTPTLYRYLAGALDGPRPLPRVRLVVLGGEEALKTDVDLFRTHFSPSSLFVNLAGQTESSLNLLCILDKERASALARASVPMGFPVEETEVVLLDERGAPTEICGEIGVRSRQVALGYWGQPELTRRVFLPADADGTRTYRTGDRGRRLADGSLEFLGRSDLQVKIRGVRVELPEIEAALLRHPGVRAAACSAWQAGPGDRRLVAYWVAKGEPPAAASALRDFLRQRLPEPMVPSFFVPMDALPQTPSGKLDRRALPVPEAGRLEAERRLVAPRDELELQLARAWKQVLGIEGLGVHDDFFDLGGHSLMAVRLFAEIEKLLGVRIPLATLFEAPTIELQAAILRKHERPAWSSLVPLQAGGALPPFFGVHGHSGEVLFYRDLSRCLGPDQPFFALQARGLNGQPSHPSIEAMAAYYLEVLRSVQPVGPYRIGGYCMGAFVAFEMAQQLRERGEAVALLALFVGHASEPRERSFLDRAAGVVGRLAARLGQARALRGRARLASLAASGRDLVRALAAAGRSGAWRLAHGILDGAPDLPAWLLRDVAEMNLQAARSYRPSNYPGRMTVFLSGDLPPGYSLDPAVDLDGLLARDLDVMRVPGTTDTMMKEPHVVELGRLLRSCLAGVRAEEPRA